MDHPKWTLYLEDIMVLFGKTKTKVDALKKQEEDINDKK